MSITIEKNFTVKLKECYVYIHRRKTNDEVFYVGKGRAYRWKLHSIRSQFWKNVANKSGVYCEIVANSLTQNEAFLLEKKLISFYGRMDKDEGTLVNLSDGVEGQAGYIPTAEQRQKISIRSKQQYHSPERRLKLSLAHKGKVVSEASKKKMSISRAGTNLLPHQITSRPAIIMSDKMCFQIARYAYEYLVSEGLSSSKTSAKATINAVLRGDLKTAYGETWCKVYRTKEGTALAPSGTDTSSNNVENTG